MHGGVLTYNGQSGIIVKTSGADCGSAISQLPVYGQVALHNDGVNRDVEMVFGGLRNSPGYVALASLNKK